MAHPPPSRVWEATPVLIKVAFLTRPAGPSAMFLHLFHVQNSSFGFFALKLGPRQGRWLGAHRATQRLTGEAQPSLLRSAPPISDSVTPCFWTQDPQTFSSSRAAHGGLYTVCCVHEQLKVPLRVAGWSRQDRVSGGRDPPDLWLGPLPLAFPGGLEVGCGTWLSANQTPNS